MPFACRQGRLSASFGAFQRREIPILRAFTPADDLRQPLPARFKSRPRNLVEARESGLFVLRRDVDKARAPTADRADLPAIPKIGIMRHDDFAYARV